jgi:hypothetical protein
MRLMIIGRDGVNAAVLIEFLIEFRKRLIKNAGREILLFVDRGSAHRAKKVRAFGATPGEKLRLFFLPPYGPARNPDAVVWKHGKADTAGCMAVTSRGRFREKVRRAMREPRKIHSFLQKPSLKYAA